MEGQNIKPADRSVVSEHHCISSSTMMRKMYEIFHNTNSTDLCIMLAMDSDINRKK